MPNLNEMAFKKLQNKTIPSQKNGKKIVQIPSSLY